MKKLVLILFFPILACSMPTLGQDNAARHRPVSYGFVIDNSGSFRPLIERVIKLVNSLSEKNSDGDETFLITFVDPTKTKIRQELTSDKAEIREAAENMYVEGGLTAVLDAVRLSIDYLSTNVRNRNDRDLALLL
ncbi:MAG: vWA domain-containing protein, partial [Pyrinomonadaceae bacterium]